jgi:Poly(R)-hydroxyalkanoic acid synthase subunit (PHA_synth_III_E)
MARKRDGNMSDDDVHIPNQKWLESRLSENRSSQTMLSQDSEGRADPFAAMRQLSAASVDVMSAWTEAWGAMLTNRGASVGKAMVRSVGAPTAWPAALVPILDEIRSALKLPTFSDLPGRDLFMLPSLAPLLGLIQVAQEYAQISVPIWIKAMDRFIAEAKKRQGAGAKADAGELMDVWNNVLDLTMMEFNRSGEFARAQRMLLHAAAAQRRELGGAVEKLAKAVDMPTRTEMTDVYRRLHELTREVYALRRELRELRRGAKPAAASKRKA